MAISVHSFEISPEKGRNFQAGKNSLKSPGSGIFFKIKLLSQYMCFDEWIVNEQLTKV